MVKTTTMWFNPVQQLIINDCITNFFAKLRTEKHNYTYFWHYGKLSTSKYIALSLFKYIIVMGQLSLVVILPKFKYDWFSS